MTRTRFGKTLKAFSYAAAIFAGTLGAGLCGSLFASCENMGGDVSPALLLPQQSGGSGTRAASKKVGRGRVTGNISQSPDVAASTGFCASSDSGMSADVAASNDSSQPTAPSASDALISKSVLPDMSDVTIASYDVSAWGTKADGTVVPKTSPVHGTAVVAPTGADFTLELDYGNWFVRADALDSGGKIVLSQTQDNVEVNDDSPVVSLAFKVSYYQEAGVTGSFALPISLDPSLGIANVIYRMTSADGSVDIGGTYGVTGLSSFVLDSTKSGSFATVAPGNCDLVIEFHDALDGLVMRIDQAVQIYSNVTTKKIDGTAPYINTSGGGAAINITSDVMKKYKDTVVYVGGTGASDTNNGTRFDPVETMGRALQILDASAELGMSPATGFTIYVNGDVSLTASVTLDKTYKLSIIGRNTSSYYKIDGALTHGITMSGSSLVCKNITFNKIKGFVIGAGQAELTDCQITNGQIQDGTDGGAGLCVNGAGAKAVLKNCSISGCSTDEFGGGIYVNGDSTTTAQVDLTSCVIGVDSDSCATDSAYSNYAYRGGGGINIGDYGKAVLKDTKIFCGSTGGNASGGGIRCIGGALEITGGQINHNYAGSGGGGIWSDGTVTINGCAIGELSADATATGIGDCGNFSAKQGGGGILIEGGTLETTSGFSVIKNYSNATGMGVSAKGGGVYINGAASVTLVDTTVSYNASKTTGGGACVSNSATLFSVTGGAFNNNKAAENGGGLSLDTTNTASQNFKNVQVKDNEATGNGGGIQINNGRYLTVSGSCDISGNKAANGGGVYASGTLKFLGGTIAGNTATSEGGGVFVSGGKMYMSGDAAIGDKSAASNADENHHSNSAANGGGISIDNSAVYLGYISGTSPQKDDDFEGGIYYNYASGSGGGVSMSDDSANKLYCYKGNIDKNCAPYFGGAICTGDAGEVQISKTTLSQNIVGWYGGAISIGNTNASTVTVALADATLEKNCITKYDDDGYGGAIYAQYYNTLEISGSTYIPAGDASGTTGPGRNDVWLKNGKAITIGSTLSATPTPMATITPETYAPGTSVLADSDGSGDLVQSELSKFAVTPDSGEEWTIGYNSSSKRGVLSSAVIYVSGGSDGSDDDTVATGSSAKPYKTVAHALGKVSAPNCSIIIKESTTETEHLEITAAMAGLKIKSAGATAKTITGASGKEVKIYAASAKFENIALSAWDCVDVYDDVTGVKFNDVTVSDGHNGAAGGGVWIASGADVEAETLTVKDCYVDSNGSGGAIYVANGAKLAAKNLVIQDCHADGANANGGGVYNAGTLLLNKAQITGCAAGKKGGGIFNGNSATLLLDGVCDIPSGIYLTGGATSGITAAKPLYIKGTDFTLASGADKIPLEPEIRSGAGNEFQENSAVIKGWDPEDGSAAYEVTEAQVNCFVTSGTAHGLEYDGTASPPCGKLVDKSIAGGVTVSLGGNISFEIGTPSASGEKARFNVIDNSSGTPTYVTPTSAQIKILQYGTSVYSADAQEVAATYLSEGEYELYCKAVVGGVTYDTTVSFAASGKYIPLTLEAAAAGAVVTFDNKADGKVKYRVNGGAEHEIESNDSAAITLNAVGDKVQFFGDNAKYGYVSDSGIVDATKCSNISCSDECYVYGNIMSLVDSAGYASAKALAGENTFARLFGNNTKIKNKTNYNILLPATTLKSCCYHSLFLGCAGLTAAPELPATTMEYYCYGEMFSGCTNLAAAPELPATTLAKDCYERMFKNCKSLTTAPELPATSLAEFCYPYMFNGCTGLTAAPALPATTVTEGCYQGMFLDCTSLTTAPELPAATPIWFCYCDMFSGCTNLATAPALPATTLDTGCYSGMFKNCTKLTAAPVLPATTLAKQCYQEMFKGCTMLNSVTCLATDISAVNCTYNWLYGVAATGTFTKAAGIGVDTSGGWTSNSASGIPTGWTVQGGGAVTLATPLTIEAAVAGATVTFKNKASGTVFYKKNDDAALPCNSGETAGIELENVGDKVQFYGDNQAYATGTGASDYSNIACSADCYVYGNIMSLVNSAGFASETALTASFTFCQLFKDNVHIKNKTGADLLLPATTMTEYCYYAMFYGCTSLTTAPVLHAPTLVENCYYYMFYYCSSLKSVTCLATNISASNCTNNWLNNVSAGGTLYKAAGVTWPNGSSGVPGSWGVEDYVGP